MASIFRNHTKWGTWRFEITMTFGHEIDFGATTGTIRELLYARKMVQMVVEITGACVEEALSVKGYVGYVVNQYFAIFLVHLSTNCCGFKPCFHHKLPSKSKWLIFLGDLLVY